MPFEETTVPASAIKRPDIAVCISGTRKETLKLNIYVTASYAKEIGLEEYGRYRVFVGTGADAGKIRIVSDDDSNFQLNGIGKGEKTFRMVCGNHPSFDTPRKQTACIIIKKKEGTFDITLPDQWPEGEWSRQLCAALHKNKHRNESVEREGNKEQAIPNILSAPKQPEPLAVHNPSPSVKAKVPIDTSGMVRSSEPEVVTAPKPVITNTPKKLDLPTILNKNGIELLLSPQGKEEIITDSGSTKIDSQEAIILYYLANKLNESIGSSLLSKYLWQNKPPGEATRELEMMITGLNDRLKKINLNIFNAGTGYMLMRTKLTRK